MLSTHDFLRVVWLGALTALAGSFGCRRASDQRPAPAGSPAAHQAPAPMAAAPTWDGFRPEAGPVIVGHPVKLSDMTETEQKYGMAPSRGPGVVYQDQVALLEHGDKTIKAAESNGLGWTFDGSDPRIAALKEGDIVFATARCVGRVLKLTRSGDDVRVILGPVQLTDIVKQGNFAYDAPLDLNALTAVELPDFPGAFGSPYFDQMKKAEGGGASRSGSTGGGSTSSESHLVIDRVAYYVVSSDGAWRPMPTVGRRRESRLALADRRLDSPSVVRASFTLEQGLHNFNDVLSASPCFSNCGGLGVKLSARRAGLSLDISVVLHLERPQFTFNVSLFGKGPQAQIMLSGGAGFLMTVQGTTDPDFTSNLNETGAIPVDLILPISFGALPLELHYHQDVSIASGFSAKTSALQARMDMKLIGNLGFFYEDGHFDTMHLSAHQNRDPSHDVHGISMGINSIVVAIDQSLLMGLGAGGFAVGPYVGLTSTATALSQATEASHLMLAQPATGDCAQATLSMQVNGGIGYRMPKVVAQVVNFFLKLIQVPPIAESGTIAKFPTPFNLFPPERFQLPDGCAGK